MSQIRIDVNEMRSGANLSYGAAWLAMEGANRLSAMAVPAGVFGSLPVAHSFCSALSQTHRNHLKQLRDHEARLIVLGDKAHTTASVFVGMEERTAEALRAVL